MSYAATLDHAPTPDSDLDDELRRIRLYALRNRVLQGLWSLLVLWWGASFLTVIGLQAFEPLGEMFFVVFPVLFIGNLVLSLDLMALVVFGLVHLVMNPRVSGIAKLGWVVATWFLGLPLFLYYCAHVFSESGSDLDDPMGY